MPRTSLELLSCVGCISGATRLYRRGLKTPPSQGILRYEKVKNGMERYYLVFELFLQKFFDKNCPFKDFLSILSKKMLSELVFYADECQTPHKT